MRASGPCLLGRKELDGATVSTELIVVVFAAISIGAFIKGMTGVGLPLVAVPAIATFTSVEEAVILMAIPVLGSNVALAITHRQHAGLIREYLPFLTAGFVGAVAGTLLLVSVDDRWLRLVLAMWLALYLVQYAFGDALHFVFRAKGAGSALVGAAAGTAHGASGISAHVVAPFFHGRGLEPAPYAFLVAVAFLANTGGQIITAFSTQLFTPGRLAVALFALIPTLLFTRLGIRYARSVSQRTFGRIIVGLFVLMEIKLLIDVI